MDRRNFLLGGIAMAAASRAWPFRVYSFPNEPTLVADCFYFGEQGIICSRKIPPGTHLFGDAAGDE